MEDDICLPDKSHSICEECGNDGVYCACRSNPRFNQMRAVTRDLVCKKTLDGHILMTKSDYDIVCRHSVKPIGAMVTRTVLFNLNYGKGMEEKP